MGRVFSQSSNQNVEDPWTWKISFRKRHHRHVGAPRLRLDSPAIDLRLSWVPDGDPCFPYIRCRCVRFWHKADISLLSSDVRFWGDSVAKLSCSLHLG